MESVGSNMNVLPTFLSSLTSFLHTHLCESYLESGNPLHCTGHLYLTVEAGDNVEFIVDEQILKTDDRQISYESRSLELKSLKSSGIETNDSGVTEEHALVKTDDSSAVVNSIEPLVFPESSSEKHDNLVISSECSQEDGQYSVEALEVEPFLDDDLSKKVGWDSDQFGWYL